MYDEEDKLLTIAQLEIQETIRKFFKNRNIIDGQVGYLIKLKRDKETYKENLSKKMEVTDEEIDWIEYELERAEKRLSESREKREIIDEKRQEDLRRLREIKGMQQQAKLDKRKKKALKDLKDLKSS